MEDLGSWRLDAGSMIEQRGAYTCCMLCLRQFQSEMKIRKHLKKSALHAENLVAAKAAGRVQQEKAVDSAASKRSAGAALAEPSAKRAASEPPRHSTIYSASSLAAPSKKSDT